MNPQEKRTLYPVYPSNKTKNRMPQNSGQHTAGPCIQGSQHSNGRNKQYVSKQIFFRQWVSAVNKTGDKVDSK